MFPFTIVDYISTHSHKGFVYIFRKIRGDIYNVQELRMMMENGRLQHTLVVIITLLPFGYGWGFLGHTAIYKIAQVI